MNTIVLVAAIATALAGCCAQYVPPTDAQRAAILSEQRYLSGDGTFGAAYSQEDGVEFKEESDQDGNRRGSYSYVDPSGQRRTVTYTAGKDGFRATGDHLPVAPNPPPQVAPQPQYQPQPQYNPPPQYNRPAPAYNPPAPAYNPPAQQYNPPAQQYNPPAPAYNPPAPQYNPTPAPQYNNYQPQAQYNAIPQYTTTPAPHRFYPPGKLSLSRTPDGFSYTFNKS